jgi:hypothetical protein
MDRWSRHKNRKPTAEELEDLIHRALAVRLKRVLRAPKDYSLGHNGTARVYAQTREAARRAAR